MATSKPRPAASKAERLAKNLAEKIAVDVARLQLLLRAAKAAAATPASYDRVCNDRRALRKRVRALNAMLAYARESVAAEARNTELLLRYHHRNEERRTTVKDAAALLVKCWGALLAADDPSTAAVVCATELDRLQRLLERLDR
jgi:hypothetical protein